MSDIRTPVTGSIRNPAPGTLANVVMVWLGDLADPNETSALVLPQTRETHDLLYAKLVAAWSNRADKYELASMALAVIGVETQTRKASAA